MESISGDRESARDADFFAEPRMIGRCWILDFGFWIFETGDDAVMGERLEECPILLIDASSSDIVYHGRSDTVDGVYSFSISQIVDQLVVCDSVRGVFFLYLFTNIFGGLDTDMGDAQSVEDSPKGTVFTFV